MGEAYKSAVWTNRPAYADYDAPRKFQAIQSIIAKHLVAHPNAICSYSGGADSDIMIDLIERTRGIFHLPPIRYAFFNTGLEMRATKEHVKATAAKYGVEITEHRPKINIVQATRRYGVPFVSKIMSAGLSEWQKKGVPLSIAEEYDRAGHCGMQAGQAPDHHEPAAQRRLGSRRGHGADHARKKHCRHWRDPQKVLGESRQAGGHQQADRDQRRRTAQLQGRATVPTRRTV